ncbi:MAG TPA: FtsX-like permease family protein [Polyangiaceae bacterium]|nr:FtsX-like permease family protein [Polyangiaceae bacterium]
MVFASQGLTAATNPALSVSAISLMLMGAALLLFLVGKLVAWLRRPLLVAAASVAFLASALQIGWLAYQARGMFAAHWGESFGGALKRFFTQNMTALDRIAFVVAALFVGCLIVVGALVVSRRLGRAGRRVLLMSMTGFSLLAAVVLGWWALSLPEPRGSYFVLWHQFIRVGAALFATSFVVGAMALALPAVLDLLERQGFAQYVAARHVRAGKSGFLTVISVLSIAGVGVSSFALCAVVSIMGGFGADLKRKILGNSAHISVDSERVAGLEGWDDLLDRIRLAPGVRAATPMVTGEAMASSESNTAGVIVRGIDPETIGTVIELLQNIEVGKFEYLTDPKKLLDLPPDEEIGLGPGGMRYLHGPKALRLADVDPTVEQALAPEDTYPGLILGRELARSLRVYVGDEVTLVAPLGDLGPMGVMPRTRKFRVAAIFYSGMYEYDSSHAYMTLEGAQDFFDLTGNVTSIDIKVDNPEKVAAVRPAIERAAGQGLRVRDWMERNKSLFSALKLEKIATFIILSLAIAVASFCIICTLLLMVTEKSKEIAILKSMGASDRAVLRVFVIEGLIIGGIGTVFGVITGLTTCLGLQEFGVRLDPEVYYVDRLPINVDPIEYLMVAGAALAITVLATLYPALAASRLRPVDGIRYE